MKGKFKPKHPEKYHGDPTTIFWRSSWELKVMQNLDTDKNVTGWSSEEIVIPYVSPVDGRTHRYFVDFYVEKTDGSRTLIEVKPLKQTLPPNGKKKDRRFFNEVKTYGVNQAKWDAAKTWCDRRGIEFIIITERELGLPSWGTK